MNIKAVMQMQVIRSRPDADSVLRNVLAAHSHIVEISVFVAGMSSCYIMSVTVSINNDQSCSDAAATIQSSDVCH